eukprot:30296-Pelagococcus_subviridis.AAC.1
MNGLWYPSHAAYVCAFVLSDTASIAREIFATFSSDTSNVARTIGRSPTSFFAKNSSRGASMRIPSPLFPARAVRPSL